MKIEVAKEMGHARRKMTDGAFQQAGSVLSLAKNSIREEIQTKTSATIKRIIKQLQSDERIAPQDISLIKAWIIGDAIGYTNTENDFEDWISEYKRLQHSLADYENKDCSSEELLTLLGLLEDATRITYDIANFLEKKERIQQFDTATRDGLDKNERDILAQTLIRKLHSHNY